MFARCSRTASTSPIFWAASSAKRIQSRNSSAERRVASVRGPCEGSRVRYARARRSDEECDRAQGWAAKMFRRFSSKS